MQNILSNQELRGLSELVVFFTLYVLVSISKGFVFLVVRIILRLLPRCNCFGWDELVLHMKHIHQVQGREWDEIKCMGFSQELN